MQFPPGEAPVLVDQFGPPIIDAGPPLVDMGPPLMAPPMIGQPYPPGAASVVSSVSEDEDYSYWRYSKFAIPFLLFILAVFVAIFCLTAWQARSDIRLLREGVPRDLQPPSPATSEEGGVPKWKRNLRIAVCFLAIFFILITLVVFLVTLPPGAKVGANIALGALLIIVGIIALLAFAFDVNSELDAEHCTTDPNQRPVVCETRELVATLITVFDALLALFLFVSGILVIMYGKSGDWTSKVRDPEGIRLKMKKGSYTDIPPGLFSNGVSLVRKWITSLALLAALVCAIVLLVMTIYVHEQRAKLTSVDRWNRPIKTPGMRDEVSGWPHQNTRLRYALTGLVIITVLLNLIPINMRVVAYIFGFLYIIYAILAFTAFGVDVDAIEDAKELACPTELLCVTHPYAAVAALDFIGGILLIAYVAIEYFVCHKKKKPPQGPPIVVEDM
eukprot:NODE_83_length_1684_cov_399.088632_g81_i0.p1 GENE.NODE_83_length_1684_cov_399.088632_g81_i0~~NODE_83_length_1684_cov_399.088632_g81_i0.p1  ORF type:complete len:445 (-),score=96.45 NODE_83_length_1684_cov_399.088632_g81_i0:265-1599(-)